MIITADARPSPEDLYLTPGEVADITRKSVETLANERSRGEGLPWVKLGGKVLYRSSDVMDVINRGTYGFTWARLEASMARYGMPPADLAKLVAHLRRDM